MITNVKAGRYEHITLFGQPALFTGERISRDAVPDGWYCYDLRGRDDDPMVPAAVEKHVFCNHAGTALCPAQLELGESDYRELGDEPEDGLDFLGEEICFKDFCRVHGLPEVAAEQKLMLHPAIDRNARFYYSADKKWISGAGASVMSAWTSDRPVRNFGITGFPAARRNGTPQPSVRN